MEPTDEERIRHMIDAAEAALRFVSGRSRPALDDDDMLTFALVRAIEVVGEAAARVSPAARQELDAVPWSAVIGMRNRLIHAYFDVDRDILWTTVTAGLPALLSTAALPTGSALSDCHACVAWRRPRALLHFKRRGDDVGGDHLTRRLRGCSSRCPVRGTRSQPSNPDVTSDGSRFLLNQIDETPSQPLTLVTDWTARLRR
jgi:uncharacterized protein with HEPN domain